MRNLETSLSLDELIAEATKRYRDLLNSERKTVANYWEFGRVLKSLRPKHVGDWMAFLDKQGWSYSRDQGVQIHNRYDSVKDCQDLTLKEGLDYQATEAPPPQEQMEDNPQPGAKKTEAAPSTEPPERPPNCRLTAA